MQMSFRLLVRVSAAVLAGLLPAGTWATPVPVRRPQEPMHRDFVVKGPDGKILAHAEETAVVEKDLVRSRLTFRFIDGSLDDEEAVFTQAGVFHLISDHHVQKGPSFPTPMDIMIDVPSHTVTWHETHFGKDRVRSQTLATPDDLADGIMPILVENFPPGASVMRVSWVAVAIKPMIVAVSVHPNGTSEQDPAGQPVRANEFILHPELHGIVSLLAPLLAKEPADIHIWVSDEKVPSFVKLAGPFYQGGPVWTVEPAAH
jgi:hypothetical protein